MSYLQMCNEIRELDISQLHEIITQLARQLNNMEDANRLLRCLEEETPKCYLSLNKIKKRIYFVINLITSLQEMRYVFYRYIRVSSPNNIVPLQHIRNALAKRAQNTCVKCNQIITDPHPMKYCQQCNLFIVEFCGNQYRASYCYLSQRIAIHIPPHVLHQLDYPFLHCNCHKGMVLVPIDKVILM